MSCLDRGEIEIGEYIRSENYRKLAIACSKYETKRYKEDCAQAMKKVEKELNTWISKHSKNPYIPLFIEPEQKKELDTLLRKNVSLDIKYGAIWTRITGDTR